MNWVYVVLAINSFGTAVAIAYAIAARRKKTSREKRIKALKARVEAAEAAAALKPRPAAETTSGRKRYDGSPIIPFHLATGGRSPWMPNHPDLLPDIECDLSQFTDKVTRPEGEPPKNKSRRDIHVLYFRLRRELRGRSRLVLLNALTIAYLRRNTPHTAKARTLFFRLWAERADEIAPELSPRWLVSTLRTFQEHGQTEDQRLIGVGGTLYGYLVRIYESERALTGAMPDDDYVLETVPAEAFGFPGLVPTSASVNESQNHVHALLIELSLLDAGAGRALEELLIRSYDAPNLFARADRSRLKIRGPDAEPQSPHWSFYHRRK